MRQVIIPPGFGQIVKAADKENGFPKEKSFHAYYETLDKLATDGGGKPQSLLYVIECFRDQLRSALKVYPLVSRAEYNLSSHLATHIWLLGKIG